MKHDTTESTPANTNGLLFALRGWSRGCAALARREYARSLGRKRFTTADIEAFRRACASARSSASAVTAIAALVLACRPSGASGDILRGNAYANPGAGSTQQQAAVIAAQQRQAAQVQKARDALANTTQAIQAMRLAQDAARSAAALNAGAVLNGLGAGGLKVAVGATPGTTLWLNAGAPVVSVSGGRTQVEIVQSDAKAVLTWDSFNIGQNTDLYFNQKAGGADAPQWIALNRVTDVTTNPSQILGSIKAEGQVYVVNPNGIVFHGSSQVNVHTLVASGLDFKGDTVAARDASFRQGLAADDNRANYNLGVDAGSGRRVGDVTVQSGARLVSDGSGAIYLFGKNVSNAGTILAPDGQALIAAGDRIWISKNNLGITHDTVNPDLRGVRATVQNDAFEVDGTTPRAAGAATNSGLMDAVRGNVTLSAKSVENSGVLHTTTTTKANGSVTLLAGDAAATHDFWWMWPAEFGEITMKPGSLVAVTPDESAGTAFAAQYRPSVVEFYGQKILMESGASLYAPSAKVTMVAKTQTTDATAANDPSRIYIAEGARIDLAGLAGVEVAMERNTITGNLRLDELKDSPLLRDSVLRGAKISVDLRRGTTLADMSGYYGLIEYGVQELMTSGGTLKLDSGSIITRAGSSIDLSGGSVQYLDGYIDTTRLRGADGRIYDITTARKDIAYTGIYDTYRKFESGYTEGKNAGTLILGPQFTDSNLVEVKNTTGAGNRPYFLAVEGDIRAATMTGVYQRNAYAENAAPRSAWTRLAKPGALVTGYEDAGVFYGPSVRIGAASALPAGFGPDSSFDIAGAHELTLPARLFDGRNFGSLAILSGVGGGVFTVDAGVTMNLGAFGSLDFRGAQARIDGVIIAPGGSVRLVADIAKGWNFAAPGATAWDSLSEADRPRITLGTGAAIDVSGIWINELLAGSATGVLAINGGSVALYSAYDLTLAPGARIDVSGSGRITGKSKLIAGDAGSILLENDLVPIIGFSGAPMQPAGAFDVLAADLRGFALGKGGSLALGASRPVVITDSPGAATGSGASDTLWVSSDFFSQGGFAKLELAGSGPVTVDAVITPHVVKQVGTGALWALASGGSIRDAVTTGVSDARSGYLPVNPDNYRNFAAWSDDLASGRLGFSGRDLREAMSITLANGLRSAGGNPDTAFFPASVVNALTGTVTIRPGASINLDPGSSIALYSRGDLTVDGVLSTPGGSISLGMTATSPATLRLGADARLLATGYTGATFDNGVAVRRVNAAGSVTLAANRPANSVARIATDSGSVIDVSGISGTSDFLNTASGLMGGRTAYLASAVAADAGNVTFSGFSGGFITGTIDAAATATSASGGSVTVSAGNLADALRTSLLFTDRLAAATSGAADVLAVYGPALRASGADNLAFLTATRAAFDGDFSLTARRAIAFSAPVLGIAAGAPADSRIQISSAYVSFSGYPLVGTDTLFPVPVKPSAPATLAGELTVSGGLIDIRQTLDLGGDGLGGFSTARFVSTGDIRLTVGYGPNEFVGRLQSPGAIELTGAQTYVTTASRARLASEPGFLIQSDRSVTFTGNGAAAPVPYSYGETLTVRAPDITQGGVLRAPLGKIDLQATNSLTLTAGSLTSVSAEGRIIPIGSVSGGFVTPFAVRDNLLSEVLAANPEKSVTMSGKTVEVRAGATVDVSGGGDLHAYEFIAGNGGSRDILNDSGMFAVLPGYVSPAAPVYAKSDLAAGTLKVGDSVYLEGVTGLAAGVYTLLPAHYALLDGGFAIKTIASGYDAIGAAIKLPDGSQLAGGHRTVAGTGARDAGESLFMVMSQSVFKKYSAYNEYGYSDYLDQSATKAGIAVPRLPRDGGTLTLQATDSLVLAGSGRFGAPDGGLLGNLDIDALKIALVGDTGAAPAGYLRLATNELNSFGVGSLLLGGTRSATAAGTALTVHATDILVANDAASALVVPEVILASTGAITLADGAVIRAGGAVSKTTADLLIDGNGALLRASTGERVGITRTGATTASGDITLGENVRLSATGSLSLDGTRSVTNRPTALFTAPQLALSSARVSLGDAPAGTDGLVLSGATLAALGTAQDLLLRSYGAIDLHGAAGLGATDPAGRPVMEKLTLDAAGLNGFATAGETATLAAKEIVLRNSAGATSATAATGAGELAFLADTLTVGPGVFATEGFSAARVAADRVTGDKTGSWNHTGDLTIATGLLTSGADSDTHIAATGAVSVSQGRGAMPTPSDFGGRLAISGATVALDTTVALPAGIFEATATAGDLTLGEHARISANGVATHFYEITRVSSGGTVRLTSATGAVIAASGASLDVSGDTLGGDAGRIEINAVQGAATLAGGLTGHAAAGYAGGSLVLDAGSVSDFQGLNRALNTGGFDAERSIRVRTGDITLAAGETIAAHEVSLRADTGALTVAGAILASGTDANRDGGTIALRAGNGLTLGPAALLDIATGYTTSAKGFDTQSGKVSLLADAGEIALAAGSRIKAAGGVRGGGSVSVTAQRDGADVHVTELAATVSGAREFLLYGRRDYTSTGTTTAANVTTMLGHAATWMSGASAITTRLGATGVEVRPDIHIVSAGDLNLTGDLNLLSSRYAGAPGALHYEAAGNITVNGAVSDGFSTATSAGVLQAGRSWNLGFTAGGDITVGTTATGRIIRTGTGDITIEAGRDLILANTKSVIYTAGSKVADAAGFTRGSRTGEYPESGGDIAITAGRDITAPVTQDFITGWLFRYGFANTSAGLSQSQMTVGAQSSWSVVFANFEQGVGALGGGNVSVEAGRDISNLTVVLPTTGQQTAAVGESVLSGDLVVRGGGNLAMSAGNDILGGVTMLGRGEAKLTAGGDFASGGRVLQRKVANISGTTPATTGAATTDADANFVLRDLHALFALSDASLALSARGGVQIEAIVDPMMIPIIATNRTGNTNAVPFFNSYTGRTSVQVTATSGDVSYLDNPWAGADLARANNARQIHQRMAVPANLSSNDSVIANDLLYVPGTMDLTAAQGTVSLLRRFDAEALVNQAFRLAPTPKGNLGIFARDGITAELPVIMMDVSPEYLRTAAAPFRATSKSGQTAGPSIPLYLAAGDLPGLSTNYGRGTTPSHAGDTEPVRLYVTSGDIAGIDENAGRLFVYLPKAASLKASGDINDITLAVQHNTPGAISTIEAGHDILRPLVLVTGAGSLLMEAGRDIDLTSAGAEISVTSTGNVGGVQTTGTLSDLLTYTNTALRNSGADITLTAGAANADYAGFTEKYFNPANAASVVRNLLPELRAFMTSRGLGAGLDDGALLAEFNALPIGVRQPFLLDAYFTELKEAGLDVTNPAGTLHGGYKRGFDAIKALFGNSATPAAGGDINLFGRALATKAGGDIRILAPHGKVLVDVITNPAASSQGIVTQKGGAIRIMTDGDIALANSRIFTLQGGDVLMWTSKGNITAGAGSSTRAVPPALTYLVDSDANVLLNAGSLSTGAGIGVLDANRTGTVDSRLDLIAPAGTVDAGDAGIRSVGAINIAAQLIIGTANISAGGGVTGITAAPAVNVAAVASANGTAAAAGGGASDAAEKQRQQTMAAQEQTPSVFSVEVLGYGGEDEEKKPVTTAANDAPDSTKKIVLRI